MASKTKRDRLIDDVIRSANTMVGAFCAGDRDAVHDEHDHLVRAAQALREAFDQSDPQTVADSQRYQRLNEITRDAIARRRLK